MNDWGRRVFKPDIFFVPKEERVSLKCKAKRLEN
jgi:hypothetical protein